MVNKIEKIHKLAKSGRSKEESSPLVEHLEALSDKDLLPIACSFTQFLNLANIAREHHQVCWHLQNKGGPCCNDILSLIKQLQEKGLFKKDLLNALQDEYRYDSDCASHGSKLLHADQQI